MKNYIYNLMAWILICLMVTFIGGLTYAFPYVAIPVLSVSAIAALFTYKKWNP